MKYKIAVPEDFPETKGYATRLSKAHVRLYSDFLETLITVETLMKYYDGDELKEKLNELLKKYSHED